MGDGEFIVECISESTIPTLILSPIEVSPVIIFKEPTLILLSSL